MQSTRLLRGNVLLGFLISTGSSRSTKETLLRQALYTHSSAPRLQTSHTMPTHSHYTKDGLWPVCPWGGFSQRTTPHAAYESPTVRSLRLAESSRTQKLQPAPTADSRSSTTICYDQPSCVHSWHELFWALTKRGCRGSPAKKHLQAILTVTGTGHAVPHLHHGELWAETRLPINLFWSLKKLNNNYF